MSLKHKLPCCVNQCVLSSVTTQLQFNPTYFSLNAHHVVYLNQKCKRFEPFGHTVSIVGLVIQMKCKFCMLEKITSIFVCLSKTEKEIAIAKLFLLIWSSRVVTCMSIIWPTRLPRSFPWTITYIEFSLMTLSKESESRSYLLCASQRKYSRVLMARVAFEKWKWTWLNK